MSLRQRLREKAENRLDNLIERSHEAIAEIVAGTELPVPTMARLVRGQRVDTLRKAAVTRLVDVAEREIEALYNKQQDLPLQNTDVRPEDGEPAPKKESKK